MNRLATLVLCSVLTAAALPAAAAPPAQPRTQPGEPLPLGAFEGKGVRVEATIQPFGPGGGPDVGVQEGNLAQLRFQVTDAATGGPVSPLRPASWVTLKKEEQGTATQADLGCKEWISAMLQGSLTYRAEIDLNKFFILVLNQERTISVIDPIMGVTGVTQLYTMVYLQAPGEDWAESPDATRLLVSEPGANVVAEIDLDTFKVRREVAAGVRPVRVAFQPDGKYLWVGNDAEDPAESGVTVLDARTLEVVAKIPTGAGHHEIAFSADSLRVFVTNGEAGTVSVLDTQTLAKTGDLPVGKNPVAVAFSTLSQHAYVASRDGTIAVLSGDPTAVAKTLSTAPGLAAFEFAPGDRWGFAALETEDRVVVLDASTDRLAHSVEVGKGPFQFAFTQDFAYVRCLETPDVYLLNLVQLNKGEAPPTSRVTFGSAAPGVVARGSTADLITPTGEWNTVVAVSPSEKVAHYYMEGMVGPMGSYNTYGRTPRAVRVVDRSLREIDRGVYAGKFKVPAPGVYRVGFLLDAPVVYHCFDFEAAPDPSRVHPLRAGPLRVELRSEELMEPGKPYALRFALLEGKTDKTLPGLPDVLVTFLRPPNWQAQGVARPLEDGTYEVEVTPDRVGNYQVFFLIPSRGMQTPDMPFLGLRARTEPGAPPEGRP